MANTLTYDQLSNAELNIKLKEFENEYKVLQNKIGQMLHRMEELDKEYIEVKNVLNKRTKGKL